VFKGDLHFYTADGDVRARVAEIDTGKCPRGAQLAGGDHG